MGSVSLKDTAARLKAFGEIAYNEFMLRFVVNSYQMVLFPDGRAIVKNTKDESLAQQLYTQYFGGGIK